MQPNDEGAHRRLRRLPSNYTFSLMTGTNSTMSGIPGPGRLVGELIRSGGRRLEVGLGRAATALGFGTNGIVWAYLADVGQRHDGSACALKLSVGGVDPSLPALLETIHTLAGSCARCGLVYHSAGAVRGERGLQRLFARLVRYLETGDLHSRLLSIHYIYTFSLLEWYTRSEYLHEDAIPGLKANLAHADLKILEGYDEWEALLQPARQTLALLVKYKREESLWSSDDEDVVEMERRSVSHSTGG